MKTNQHTATRSKRNRHNKQLSKDTKPLFTYDVELFWTQHNRATVRIKARSAEAARRKADKLESYEIEDWEPCAGEMYVYGVELVAGGSDDE